MATFGPSQHGTGRDPFRMQPEIATVVRVFNCDTRTKEWTLRFKWKKQGPTILRIILRPSVARTSELLILTIFDVGQPVTSLSEY